MWGCGSNGQGSLGTGDDEDHPVFVAIDSPIEPIAMDGGANHTLMVDSEGKVYGCGDGQALGIPSTNTFQLIPDLNDIVSVACGWNHSLALDRYGQVFGCGSNDYEQLGPSSLPNHQGWIPLPLNNVKKMACGLRHSLFMTNDQVIGTGQSRHGQLGLHQPFLHQYSLVFDHPATCIAAGKEFSVIVDAEHQLWTMGSNKFGQLGRLTTDAIGKVSVEGTVTHIAAGWTHALALVDGKVLSWGRHDWGQTGHSNHNPSFLPLEPIVSIATGSEHSVALSQSGNVFVWGWNEHGNLGLGHLNNAQTPTLAKQSISFISCGYGFTHVK
jgi:secretion-regulating guanine nucleotide exchange factor